MYPPRTRTKPRSTWQYKESKGESQSIQHHEYFEFRYVELEFDSAEIETEQFDLSAWSIKVPFDASSFASLTTSDDSLNKVWEMCRYTIEVGPLDVYSDSNARQRSVDCQADDVTAMQVQWAVSDQLALQRYAIEQAVYQGPASRVDWAVLPIVAVYYHTLYSGDIIVAQRFYARLLSAHANLNAIAKDTGLAENVSALVDWPPGMEDHFVRTNTSTVASAWVYYGTAALEQIATWLGKEADAGKLHATGEALKEAMADRQYNGSAYCDGQCHETSHTAFHSTMYALSFGAVTDSNREAAWEYLKARIGRPPPPAPTGDGRGGVNWPPPPPPGNNDGIPSGSYPAQFAVSALYDKASDMGEAGLEALRSGAKNSWLHMLRQGATMTMEMWTPDEKPNLTWSHPWSSSPGYLVVTHLFGIRPTAPGFRTLTIKPMVGKLVNGTVSLPTVRGRIGASFQQANGHFWLQISLPAGCIASVAVPLPSRDAKEHEVGPGGDHAWHNGVLQRHGR